MRFKLGKRPARKNAVLFLLSRYIDFSKYPAPPDSFGNYKSVRYQMFGNDRYGDCVLAGAANEQKDWCSDAGVKLKITTANVLRAYSEVTGFDPKKPETDDGTDMQEAADYRRKTGIIDAAGNRHKIYAYATLPHSDLRALKAAMYYFGGAGIGIEFPSWAMDQFDAKEPWTPIRGGQLEGGHYVAGVGWKGENIVVATWGRIQEMTPAFAKKYMDEVVFYLDPARIRKNLTPEGLRLDRLQADIDSLKRPGR